MSVFPLGQRIPPATQTNYLINCKMLQLSINGIRSSENLRRKHGGMNVAALLIAKTSLPDHMSIVFFAQSNITMLILVDLEKIQYMHKCLSTLTSANPIQDRYMYSLSYNLILLSLLKALVCRQNEKFKLCNSLFAGHMNDTPLLFT